MGGVRVVCCVYRWTNLINNKFYIGSSFELRGRFRDYYNSTQLTSHASNIYKAILKYGPGSPAWGSKAREF